MNRRRRALKNPPVFAPAGGGLSFMMLAALTLGCLFALLQTVPVRAQDQGSKVPLVGKLSPGRQQQAYSGKIQSLDMKQKILNLNSLHGRESEIFPIKKNVRVESLGGDRMKLTALEPGMTVLIYYDQRSGERTVKNIVILSSDKGQEKGKPAPSS